MLPNESMKRTEDSSRPSRTVGAGKCERHEVLDGERRADRFERPARREVRPERREDVAAVEGRGDASKAVVRVLEDPGLDGAAEDVGRRHEHAVVRPDEDIAAGSPDRDRVALGPDAGIDDDHVDADRHPRHG